IAPVMHARRLRRLEDDLRPALLARVEVLVRVGRLAEVQAVRDDERRPRPSLVDQVAELAVVLLHVGLPRAHLEPFSKRAPTSNAICPFFIRASGLFGSMGTKTPTTPIVPVARTCATPAPTAFSRRGANRPPARSACSSGRRRRLALSGRRRALSGRIRPPCSNTTARAARTDRTASSRGISRSSAASS